MGKWFGKVGYSVTEETVPGVWEEKITERSYYGEVKRYSRRWDKGSYQNDDFRITNNLEIIADAYANEHYNNIKYVWIDNTRWKVTGADKERPRIILTLGTEYNGGDINEHD